MKNYIKKSTYETNLNNCKIIWEKRKFPDYIDDQLCLFVKNEWKCNIILYPEHNKFNSDYKVSDFNCYETSERFSFNKNGEIKSKTIVIDYAFDFENHEKLELYLENVVDKIEDWCK